jgi:hypothetical protein
MGGAVKTPARSCSRSQRICQIRPSTNPIAIATAISKTMIKNTKIIGVFLVQHRKPSARFLGARTRSLGLCARLVEPANKVAAIRV